MEVQLEGNIKFCVPAADGTYSPGDLVDFSDEVSKLLVTRTRNTIDRQPTFADARVIKRAAALVEQVTIMFLGDETDNTGTFWALVWAALDTSPCNLAYEATMKVGAASATNPKYSGYVTVVDVDGGGTPGETKWQSKTWPGFGCTKSVQNNEVQQIVFDATGGTFTVTYSGQTTSAQTLTTTTVATLTAALEALSNIAPGDVLVQGSVAAGFTVTFIGTLANTNVAQMTLNVASLTGGSAAVRTVRAGG